MTTDLFHEDDTDGFTPEELTALNEAAARLLAPDPDLWGEMLDPASDHQARKTISDKLTNVWLSGMTADELETAVRARMFG